MPADLRLLLQALVAGLRLLVHVVDLDLADGAVLERFAEHDAGVVGVHVHLDEPRVAHDEGAVADGLQKGLERPRRRWPRP